MIQDRIRKLLRTNGRTQAEIGTAQALAAALAEKHQIDLAEIERTLDREPVKITHRQIAEWAKRPPEADYAALICGSFFDVTCLWRRGWTDELIIVGTVTRIDIADYVFNFLLTRFRAAWRDDRGRCKKRKKFMWGVYIGLASSLTAQRHRPEDPTGLALVPSDEARRDQYVADEFGPITTSNAAPKKTTGRALERGYRSGRKIQIRDGLGAAPPADQLKPPPKLLT